MPRFRELAEIVVYRIAMEDLDRAATAGLRVDGACNPDRLCADLKEGSLAMPPIAGTGSDLARNGVFDADEPGGDEAGDGGDGEGATPVHLTVDALAAHAERWRYAGWGP